jgi:hypothetical protein
MCTTKQADISWSICCKTIPSLWKGRGKFRIYVSWIYCFVRLLLFLSCNYEDVAVMTVMTACNQSLFSCEQNEIFDLVWFNFSLSGLRFTRHWMESALTPYSPEGIRRFGLTCRFHLEGRIVDRAKFATCFCWFLVWITLRSRMWRRCVSPKRRYFSDIHSVTTQNRSRDSVVGISTRCGLDDRRVKNFIFSTSRLARVGPTSYPMGTGCSFPGGKAAGAWSWPLTSS